MPPDIEAIDRVVCLAPQVERQVLIIHYTHRGPIYGKCADARLSRYKYLQALARGESFVAQMV